MGQAVLWILCLLLPLDSSLGSSVWQYGSRGSVDSTDGGDGDEMELV